MSAILDRRRADGMLPVGPPMDLRRERYAEKFGLLAYVRPWRTLTQSFMDQLDRCADDSARRLLLGGERAL